MLGVRMVKYLKQQGVRWVKWQRKQNQMCCRLNTDKGIRVCNGAMPSPKTHMLHVVHDNS